MKKPPARVCADDAAPKRLRILDAAFKAFLTKGYAGTSTLEIASTAKVSKRELYSYFKDKEALFAAGIKGRTDIMRVPLGSPDLSSRTALEKTLVAYGVSLLAGVMHPHVLAVHRLAIAESARTPELAEILDREGRQANSGALTELMRSATTKGLVAGSSPEEMAADFASVLFGDLFTRVLLRAIDPPLPAEIERRARKAATAFLTLHAE